LRGARRRALHAALRGARADGHRIERYGGHLHLHVGHEAILIRLARDRDPRWGQAEVAHDELVLPAAVREEDGEASTGVRGPLARHLGFERRRLDDRSRQRLVVGARDGTGDDVGGRADLSRTGERRDERAESDEQPAGQAWHHGAASYTRRKSMVRPRPPSKLTIT